MADFAVVQAALRTTTGTQDFTVSGFGTPKAVLFLISGGTVAGTAVNDALLDIGCTDGTRAWTINTRSQDALTTSLGSLHARNADMCFLLQNRDDTAAAQGVFSAWITDGVRVTVTIFGTTAAWLCTAILIGGTGVLNAYGSTIATPATINTGTATTAPNFLPTLVIAAGAAGGVYGFNETNESDNSLSLGFCYNDGGAGPFPQSCMMWWDQQAATTMNIIGGISETRISKEFVNVTSRAVEITAFGATGFTATTRDLGAASTIGYLALELDGLAAKVQVVDVPTSTGVQSWTGIGFIPQFALLGLTALTSTARALDDTAEVAGISAITTAASACTAIYMQDNVADSNTESVAHTRPIFLRKGAATFVDATFDSFSSDTLSLNYATAAPTSARKAVALFVESSAVVAPAPNVSETATVAEDVTMRMHLTGAAPNEAVTAVEAITMHMPLNVPMMKLP